eukprot:1434054-Amphidinium_carterae.1
MLQHLGGHLVGTSRFANLDLSQSREKFIQRPRQELILYMRMWNLVRHGRWNSAGSPATPQQ